MENSNASAYQRAINSYGEEEAGKRGKLSGIEESRDAIKNAQRHEAFQLDYNNILNKARDKAKATLAKSIAAGQKRTAEDSEVGISSVVGIPTVQAATRRAHKLAVKRGDRIRRGQNENSENQKALDDIEKREAERKSQPVDKAKSKGTRLTEEEDPRLNPDVDRPAGLQEVELRTAGRQAGSAAESTGGSAAESTGGSIESTASSIESTAGEPASSTIGSPAGSLESAAARQYRLTQARPVRAAMAEITEGGEVEQEATAAARQATSAPESLAARQFRLNQARAGLRDLPRTPGVAEPPTEPTPTPANEGGAGDEAEGLASRAARGARSALNIARARGGDLVRSAGNAIVQRIQAPPPAVEPPPPEPPQNVAIDADLERGPLAERAGTRPVSTTLQPAPTDATPGNAPTPETNLADADIEGDAARTAGRTAGDEAGSSVAKAAAGVAEVAGEDTALEVGLTAASSVLDFLGPIGIAAGIGFALYDIFGHHSSPSKPPDPPPPPPPKPVNFVAHEAQFGRTSKAVAPSLNTAAQQSGTIGAF